MGKWLRWESLGALIGIALVSAIGAGIFYQTKQDDWARPDATAMRAFRLRQMTDDKIRELRAAAVADEVKYKQIDQQQRDQYWKERAELNAKCDDIVFRTRNETQCSRGPLDMFSRDQRYTPSADKLFEEYILGICYYVDSREEARSKGCLPPK